MSNLAPNPADPTQRIISAFQTAQAAGRQPRMSDIVGGAIDAMVLQFRHNGGDILHTEDKWYQFNPGIGIWVIRDALYIEAAIDEWFRNIIGVVPNKSLRSEVLTGVRVRVFQDTVDWGRHGNVIICTNNVAYCLETNQQVSVRKDWYLREENVLAVEWQDGAVCPTWDRTVDQLMQHIDPAERSSVIELIEEWMASCLYRHRRPRAMSKCLFLYGERRTGKSTILDIPRQIFGEKLATAIDLQELNGFGAQALMGKAVWLSDEIKVGTVMNDSIIKRIITNEPLSIKVKFERPFEGRLNLTVGLAGNSLPKIDDTSDAVYDRTLFVPMDTVIDYTNESQTLKDDLDLELPGLLQRMVQRLQTLKTRGHFDIPPCLIAKQDEIKTEQDPMRVFLEEAMVKANDTCAVKMTDVVAAYRGHLALQYGREYARTAKVSPIWVSRRLTESYPSSQQGKVNRGTIRARFGLHFTDKGKTWLDAGWGLEDTYYKTDQTKLKEANINTGVTAT